MLPLSAYIATPENWSDIACVTHYRLRNVGSTRTNLDKCISTFSRFHNQMLILNAGRICRRSRQNGIYYMWIHTHARARTNVHTHTRRLMASFRERWHSTARNYGAGWFDKGALIRFYLYVTCGVYRRCKAVASRKTRINSFMVASIKLFFTCKRDPDGPCVLLSSCLWSSIG